MILQPCAYFFLSWLEIASSHRGHTKSFRPHVPNDRSAFASFAGLSPAILRKDVSRAKSANKLSPPFVDLETRAVLRGRRPSFLHEFSLHNSAGNDDNGGGNANDFSSLSETNFYNDLESLFPENEDSGMNNPQQQRSQESFSSSPHPEGIDAAEQTSSATISDESLLSALQKRQNQLKKSSRELLRKWRTGIAKTFVGFTINEHFYLPESELGYLLSDQNNNNNNNKSNRKPLGETSGTNRGKRRPPRELPFDWVRRVGIGSYPRVVCGSAHGSVFVADVELGRLLGVARGVHFHGYDDGGGESRLSDGMHERLRQWLYGDYDGGGVLAVDMYGLNFVASSGREGGLKLFKFVERAKGGGGGTLEFMGIVPTLARPLPGTVPTLVTSLKFDSLGRLFAGGADGYLRMVTFPERYFGVGDGMGNLEDESDVKVTVISSTGSNPSPILSLDISEDMLPMSTMIATCHANGNVIIHSVSHELGNEDGGGAITSLGSWNPFSSGNTSHARSVAFVSKHDKVDTDEDDRHFAVVIGGGNGEIWVCDLELSSLPSNDNSSASNEPSCFRHESTRKINPLHNGPVLALATRPGGIVISAAHDGLLRVSQVWNDENGQAGGKELLPKSLYGLMGYKVWIGNICIDDDGKRLISDGKDDVVVVHDFSKDPLEDDWNPGS